MWARRYGRDPGGGCGHWGGLSPHWPSPHPCCPQLTFVDFLMFDVLDQNRIFEPKCLEPFKNLKDFMDRFGVSGGTPGITFPP